MKKLTLTVLLFLSIPAMAMYCDTQDYACLQAQSMQEMVDAQNQQNNMEAMRNNTSDHIGQRGY